MISVQFGISGQRIIMRSNRIVHLLH